MQRKNIFIPFFDNIFIKKLQRKAINFLDAFEGFAVLGQFPATFMFAYFQNFDF